MVYPIGIKKSTNPWKEVIKSFEGLKNLGLDVGEGVTTR